MEATKVLGCHGGIPSGSMGCREHAADFAVSTSAVPGSREEEERKRQRSQLSTALSIRARPRHSGRPGLRHQWLKPAIITRSVTEAPVQFPLRCAGVECPRVRTSSFSFLHPARPGLAAADWISPARLGAIIWSPSCPSINTPPPLAPTLQLQPPTPLANTPATVHSPSCSAHRERVRACARSDDGRRNATVAASRPRGAAAPGDAFAGRGARPRRVHRRRLAERARHFLRRQRRLRHHGWRVRVREPVQPGVRGEQRGAEHGAVQRGAEVRGLLRDPVREPAGVGVVPPGAAVHRRHRHQLLPAQLRAPLGRRRLVQPAPPPLRPRHAHVPPHGAVPRRHRPRLLPPGGVPEVGRGAVHDQRVQVLQPGADHQRGGGGGPGARQREGVRHRVDAHVPQLGPELAVQRHPRRPGPLLPRHRQRPPHLHLLERRAAELALRADLRGQELQGLVRLLLLLLRRRPAPWVGGSSSYIYNRVLLHTSG